MRDLVLNHVSSRSSLHGRKSTLWHKEQSRESPTGVLALSSKSRVRKISFSTRQLWWVLLSTSCNAMTSFNMTRSQIRAVEAIAP